MPDATKFLNLRWSGSSSVIMLCAISWVDLGIGRGMEKGILPPPVAVVWLRNEARIFEEAYAVVVARDDVNI